MIFNWRMAVRGRWAWALLAPALAVFLALAFLHLSGPMEAASLDWSWNGALSYFAARQLQFGKDVIFTYGPLGYIYSGTYSGFLLETKVLGSIANGVALGLINLWLIKEARSPILWLVVLFAALCFGRFHLESAIFAAIAVAACLAITPKIRAVWLLLLGAIFAFFSLQKFTFLLLGIVAVAVVTLFFVWRRNGAKASAMLLGYVSSLLVFWLASHQQLGNLGDFLWGSFDVANGYSQAMHVAPKWSLLWLGISEVVVIGTMVMAMILYERQKEVALSRAVVLLAALFLGWKQSFVRADYDHALFLFILAQYLCVLIYTMRSNTTESGSESLMIRGRRHAVLGTLALIGLTISYSALREVSRYPRFQSLFSLEEALGGVRGNAWRVTHYGEYAEFLERELRASKRRHDLSRLKQIVGDKPVDVFGDEVGIAVLNDLNYRPRPSFQSYSAYTPYLLNKNGAFYLSDAAPKYAILKYETIDERLPSQSDSKAFEAILSAYEPVGWERGYTLWEKKVEPLSKPKRQLDWQGEASIGMTVSLPPREKDKIQWLAIHTKLTFLGKMRSFLYQPPAIKLRLVTKNGQGNEFKLVRSLAQEAFLINPPLRGSIDLLNFILDRQTDEIASFELRVARRDRWFIESGFRYEIFSSRKPLYDSLPKGLWQAFYPFQSEPLEVEASNYTRVLSVNDQDVLFAHAPSRLSFRVPASAREMTGHYGILPGAFTDRSNSPAVEFTVEQESPSGKLVLFSQSLRESGDRFFRINIPEKLQGGVVVLTAKCDRDCTGGWSYWTNVGFQ